MDKFNTTLNTWNEEWCLRERKWWIFLFSSIVTYIAGMLLILTFNMCDFIYLIGKNMRSDIDMLTINTNVQDSKSGWNYPEVAVKLQNWAAKLLLGKTTTGKRLMALTIILNVEAVIVYIIDTTKNNVEACQVWKESSTQINDIALNMFFMAHFFIRFIAARNKLGFMLELYTFVDILTIPPCIVSIYLDRTWIGLRFLRAFWLQSIDVSFQCLGILKTKRSIHLTKLVCIVLSILLTMAGSIHLLENSGDPLDFINPQPLTYFECLYFVITTLSTVGFGDIYCQTTLGRAFITLYILVGLAAFVCCIFEILVLLADMSNSSGEYQKEQGKRHIVVCGSINYDSVSKFLNDFFHKNRGDCNVDVVFLHREQLDQKLKDLSEQHFTIAKFIQGTVMNQIDMQKVTMNQADACLILANKQCQNQDAEDAANIMRVISIKNYSKNIRVIVQLMQYHNKSYILNMPGWNGKNGDDIICLAELKLGFLAHSCMAPGFSTMISNLFCISSNEICYNTEWRNDYLYGTGMQMHTEIMSRSFNDMSFQQAAELCYKKLRLVLLAIEITQDGADSKIMINPKSQMKLTSSTQGYFIAESADLVKSVRYYCKDCHADVKDVKKIMVCKCNITQDFSDVLRPPVTTANTRQQCSSTGRHCYADLDTGRLEIKYDSTGMFHWCPERSIEDCILDPSQAAMTIIKGHVVLCLLADKDSPVIGLQHFVWPLRASNIHYQELQHLIIVGDVDYLKREWKVLRNLPKISILSGSPLKANLQVVNINLCDMCVILSAMVPNSEDPALTDKEVILATLNIKAMTFNDTFVEVPHNESTGRRTTPGNAIVLQRRGSLCNTNFHLLTELVNDRNMQFLEQNHINDMDNEVCFTESFACGEVFAVSVLDSLMSTAYFNAKAVTFIRSLITGSQVDELELIRAENVGLRGGYSTPLNIRNRCRVGQISLSDEPFASYGDDGKYGDLFVDALKNYGMLCLGLSKYKDSSSTYEGSMKRYVITNPLASSTLTSSDKVFVLMQFDPEPRDNRPTRDARAYR